MTNEEYDVITISNYFRRHKFILITFTMAPLNANDFSNTKQIS